MNREDEVIQKLRELSHEDRQKVVELVEQLAAAKPQCPRKDPLGMFAHHGIDMPLEVFQESRREMWEDFPREFPVPGDQ